MKSTAPLAVAIGLCALAAGCSAGPELEFADWIFPIPEGTPIREYAPVPLEDRAENTVELVEDLVIGGDTSDPNATFYRPTSVVASDEGNIYVVDSGNNRVQMFGPDGAFIATIGGEGQGPGELSRPRSAAIVNDQLIVQDSGNQRFSVWTLDGEHVADYGGQPLLLLRFFGLSNGDLVYQDRELNRETATSTDIVASFSPQGEQRVRFLAGPARGLGSPPRGSDTRTRVQASIDNLAAVRPSMTSGPGDIVYVTPAQEYQILAYDGISGEMIWALRVALSRRPFPESTKDMQLRITARDAPEIKKEDLDWPELDEAISSTIRTDGHGRLYVLPRLAAPEEDDSEGIPIDVYSPDGELLAAGMSNGLWDSARGDHVYTLRPDAASGEYLVKRYRLVLHR